MLLIMERNVQQIVELRDGGRYPQNIALRCFDEAYYNALSPELQQRFLRCLDSGRIRADSTMGWSVETGRSFGTRLTVR